LNLPGHLYNRLKPRAEQAHRTVEAELLEGVAPAVPVADELPAELSEARSPLALLDDEALWRAARSHLPAEAAVQMENLHLKRQREGLTETEAQTLAGPVRLAIRRRAVLFAPPAQDMRPCYTSAAATLGGLRRGGCRAVLSVAQKSLCDGTL
jgi:hypothetical protein